MINITILVISPGSFSKPSIINDMKFIRLLVFFSLILSSGYSQHSFELLISNTNDEYPFEVFQTEQGEYFMAMISRVEYTDYFYSKIIRISPLGVIMGETEIVNPEGDCILYNLLRTGENTMVAIGEWKHTGANSEIWYVSLDTSLNILWDKKYKIDEDWITFIRSFINSEGNIVSGASIAQLPYIYTSKLVFLELTLSGDSIYGCYNLTGNSPLFYDIIEFDTTYLAFTHGFLDYPGDDILTLDQNFNILSVDSIPHRLERCLTAKKRNNTSIYLTGNYYFNSQSDIGIELLNSEFKQIHFTYTGEEDLRDYCGADQSMDFYFPDTIFTAGTKNIDPYEPYYSDYHSWYCLNNFDSALNLRWSKFYGGDAYYVLRYILATPDGGALLSGTKYDTSNPQNKLDIYIIKVDSCGLITGMTETKIPSGHQMVLFPNPGTDQCFVDLGGQYLSVVLTIFDLNGNICIKQALSQHKNRVITSHLLSGIYFYTITTSDRVIGSGKWIRQ